MISNNLTNKLYQLLQISSKRSKTAKYTLKASHYGMTNTTSRYQSLQVLSKRSKMAKYTLKASHYDTINTTSHTNHYKFRVKSPKRLNIHQKHHIMVRSIQPVVPIITSFE